ncbi:Dna Ligase 3 [Manis pentadactyla]|nr:Dna Ligase 3 [Manis pentadactyla]
MSKHFGEQEVTVGFCPMRDTEGRKEARVAVSLAGDKGRLEEEEGRIDLLGDPLRTKASSKSLATVAMVADGEKWWNKHQIEEDWARKG